MHLFGRSIKRICENLSLFKEPGFDVPYKVKRKLVKEILRNERYAGYKFITDGNKIIEKRTNQGIINKRIFTLFELKSDYCNSTHHITLYRC